LNVEFTSFCAADDIEHHDEYRVITGLVSINLIGRSSEAR
jgi:hypothetical protein